ncbi:hypothetical protein QOT17_006152 [Balamuthia mandrillaris]
MKYRDIVSCVAAVLAGWMVPGLLFDHQRPGYVGKITEDNFHQTLEESKFVVVFSSSFVAELSQCCLLNFFSGEYALPILRIEGLHVSKKSS